MVKEHMFRGMLLLCISAIAAQDQSGACKAERGDDCKTVASSMMQTHSVRSKVDFHEIAEAGADEEHRKSKEENQHGLRIVKHGNYIIRIWKDAITHDDGTNTWIFTNKKDCDPDWTKTIEKCMPPGMVVKNKGNPEDGGLCFESLQGTEEQIKQELSNCKDKLDANSLDIETDKAVHLPDEKDEPVKDGSDALAEAFSSNAPASWGLDRIDQRNIPLDSNYDPSPHDTRGEGVHVFVADTGIRISHQDFGGRAFAGYDGFGKGDSQGNCQPDDAGCAKDNHFHGTHCAGTVGGTKYGVANKAKLYAVKVLSDSGSGTRAGVLAGINYAKSQAVSHNRKPAVVSMSLGGSGRSTAYEDAINQATKAGVLVVVAAGNSNHDACQDSPAFVPAAITVGSTTSTDSRSSFSSWGTCVDIFAPGSNIISCHITSDTASRSASGTSMACPHVAGAYALLMSANPNLDVAALEALMNAKATTGKGFPRGGGNDLLLYVGPGTSPPTPAPTPAPPTLAPTPSPPPAPATATNCTFESSCKWYNSPDDKFDWTRRSGNTPSSNTGPSSGADGSSHYMYIETSSPRQNGDTAILKYPPLILTGKLKFEFKYHMFGSAIGSLAVTVDGAKKWEMKGNKGNSWKTGVVNLENYVNQEPEIAFVGTRAAGWAGDIAIDSLKFVPTGSSPGPSPTMEPTPSPTMEPTPSPTMEPTAAPGPSPNPPVIVGPPGLPGPPGPPGNKSVVVGPPGPPGPPR